MPNNTNETKVRNSGRRRPFDITNVSDLAAENTMLWDEQTICTEDGQIVPEPTGVRLWLNGRSRSRFFPLAKTAIRILRRAQKDGRR